MANGPVEERIWHELKRIADALESLTNPDPESQEPVRCPHPEDLRIDLGMTNGMPDWQCGVPTCRHRPNPS
jgi:hypothetical protein